jgi:hypothetical protein
MNRLLKDNAPVKVVNVGSSIFLKDLKSQHVDFLNVTYQPPGLGDETVVSMLVKLETFQEKIDQANQSALERILAAQAKLTAVMPAYKVIPGMNERTFLHAGPPIAYQNMPGPMQGALLGAIIFEGLASTLKEAETVALSGTLIFSPAHEHQAVGPMAGIISPHMPVHVVENPVHKNTAYCSINEGLGKVLRYGANGPEVIQKLKWLKDVFAPIMHEALQLTGPIDLKQIIAQALQMGDETHNRNKAATALFLKEMARAIFLTKADMDKKVMVFDFIKNNDHYFLNLSMPSAKVALDTAQGIPYSTLVTIMARNGLDFGIKLASGPTWYTAPANYVKGLFFTGYSEKDAAPDIGDSAITETYGIGGFAMGGAPAIVQFVGGTVADAVAYSKKMHTITVGKHSVMQLPSLDFAPTALGIDIRKVIASNILPIINTGIAHKLAGVGQVGAGLVEPPMGCFKKALEGFVKGLSI